MPPRSDTKRARLQRWIAEHSPKRIDAKMFAAIRESIGPVSESYLRQMLRDSGVPLSPEVEGVVASSLTELRRTLIAFANLYAAGNKQVRAVVIEAKNRLRWAQARSKDESKNALRSEMILWTMTWLENPGAFELWIGLREKAGAGPRENF